MSPFSLTPNAQPAHQPAFQTQVFHSKESLFALAAKKRTQTHDFFFFFFLWPAVFFAECPERLGLNEWALDHQLVTYFNIF
jgi:hypothetical protein